MEILMGPSSLHRERRKASVPRRIKLIRKILVTAICVPMLYFFIGVADPEKSIAQPSAAQEHQVQAVFLYKFCGYTTWPVQAFESESSPFILGVAGSANFVRELREVLQNRTIKERPVQVQHVREGQSIRNVHVLFIERRAYRDLSYWLSSAEGLPILTVTDSLSGTKTGGVVNFIIDNNRLRFDIDLVAAKQQNLHLSAQLLQVARRVDKAPPP